VSELAQQSAGYEREPPEVMARNLRIASQLWASGTVFFFFAFLFAYFYLRSLNSQGLWHPHNVKAPVGFGTVITTCVAISALAAWSATRRLQAGDDSAWRRLGILALLLGLAAFVLQIVEYSMIGFGPTEGGFASVFLGWTGLYSLFVLGTMYWLETLLATSFRNRGTAVEDRSGEDIDRPSSLLVPSANALAFYWAVLAAIGVATWLILYLL
jgi:heme/copper-type cytochrome/quinol oxidase subunit 3